MNVREVARLMLQELQRQQAASDSELMLVQADGLTFVYVEGRVNLEELARSIGD